MSRCGFCGFFFRAKPTSTHTYCKKAIRESRCRFGRINISPANFTSMKKKNPAEPTSTHTYCFGRFLHQIMTGKNRWQPADWNGIIKSVKELWHLV